MYENVARATKPQYMFTLNVYDPNSSLQLKSLIAVHNVCINLQINIFFQYVDMIHERTVMFGT